MPCCDLSSSLAGASSTQRICSQLPLVPQNHPSCLSQRTGHCHSSWALVTSSSPSSHLYSGHGWHGSDSSSSLQDSSPSWLCLQAPSHSHDGPSRPGSAHVSAWLPLPLPPTSPWGPSSTQGSLSHWPIREHLLPGEPLSPVLEPGRSHHPKILTQFSPPQEGLTPGGQTQGPPAASSCGRALAPRPGAGSVDAGLWVDP